jgi:adenosylhomocysteine nucleosidase
VSPFPAQRARGAVAVHALMFGLAVPCLAVAAAPPHALCETAARAGSAGPRVAILSAFPAEIAPLVRATTIEETVEVVGRRYHLGRLEGVRVVLGLTGIGLVNAERATAALLADFDVAGIIMSGVAGSPYRIGDVVIARRFTERERAGVWRANRALLALARRAAVRLSAPLGRCTPVPPTVPDAPQVCMPHQPTVVVAKHGVSEDPFGGEAVPCVPGGGEIFGCEFLTASQMRAPDTVDMETAVVARLAASARVPFLALRAVSDGAGDPLGERGFPAQFADYYALAAGNAAAVAHAVLAELGPLVNAEAGSRTCRLLARGRWRRAAARIRTGRR